MLAKIHTYKDAIGVDQVAIAVGYDDDGTFTYFDVDDQSRLYINSDGVIAIGAPASIDLSPYLRQVDQLHADYLLKSVSNPTQKEIDSWGFKATLAKLISVGGILTVADEEYLANAKIITIGERDIWAKKVLTDKAVIYAGKLGRADYLRKKHKTALAAVQTQADLDALMHTIQSDWENLI